MARPATTTSNTPKAPRVVKPKTYWLVADGITSEQLRAGNVRIVSNAEELLSMQDAAMENGTVLGRVKLTLPKGPSRKKADASAA